MIEPRRAERSSRQELEDTAAFLADMPGAVTLLGAGLGDGELMWKPAREEFSFLEHVCHLRDIEREGYSRRIRLLLTGGQPLLPDIDGAKLAAERRYNEQDFSAGLGEFTSAREENVRVIRELTPEQLSLAGTFEGAGPVTLEKLLSMMREHDAGHRADLVALRETLLARRRAGGR